MVQMYHSKTHLSIFFARCGHKGAKLYHMNKRLESKAFVRECITTALLQMLQTQRLDDISVVALIEKAGVCRNSFYRNFADKQDVLREHLAHLMRQWGEEFERRGDASAFSETLLRHYYAHKELYLLLYRQGLSDMIYETIRSACKLGEAQTNLERYGKSMFAGMI